MRLRWSGHVERKTEEDVAMKTLEDEMSGHRKIARLKLRRWRYVIQKDTKETEEDTGLAVNSGREAQHNLERAGIVAIENCN